MIVSRRRDSVRPRARFAPPPNYIRVTFQRRCASWADKPQSPCNLSQRPWENIRTGIRELRILRPARSPAPGFLRGTDIVKAVALGATAVGVGRLNGFGIAAAGAAGIARVLELLEGELRACLGLLGANRFEELGANHLHRTEPVHGGGMRSAYPLLDEDPWTSG